MYEEYEEDDRRGFGDFEHNLPQSKQDHLDEGWPGIFYRKIFNNIDESKFKVLFSSDMGRPNFPVKILIALEILRQLFDLTDKEVVDSFNYDVRFMKAVGLKRVGQLNLSYRTVYEFRDRIVEHAKETGNNLIKEIFEELTDELIEVADLETEIQKMDSTMVDANIKHLSRIELMRRTLDNFVSDLDEQQKQKIHKNILAILSEEKFQEYLDEYAKKEIREILLGKIKTVKQHFKNDDEVNSLESYELLCRLVDDQTIEAGGELKDDEDISADSLQNPNDPDATYRRKGNSSSQGYSLNISETSHPDNPVQMITDVAVEPNVCSDVDFLENRLPGLNERTALDKLLVDGGYHGETTQTTADEEDVELVPTDLTGQDPEYSTAGFKLKDEQGIAACPAGVVPQKSKYLEKNDYYAAWFKKSDCSGCSFRNKCPITEQKQDMTLRFTGRRHELDRLREKHEDSEYKELMKLRPAVEGTISALKRAYGLYKFKVTGMIKVNINGAFKALSYNFNQLCRLITGDHRPSYST